MAKNITIEICAGSVESAIAAAKGGADRIELCSALSEGGLTPSVAVLEYVMKHLKIKTNVLIRPRGGDFNYSRAEFDVMKSDVFSAKLKGANGIVIGMLNTDGTVDTCRMKELMEIAKPLEVTFHRAFDMTKDPLKALEDIVELGCHRILTSGQAADAFSGAGLIAELVKATGDRIIIMPGSGINSSNLSELHKKTNATEFHLSATVKINSRMMFKNQGVGMGNGSCDEFMITQTSQELVSEICKIAKNL